MSNENIKCTVCEGTGIMQLTIDHSYADTPKPNEVSNIDCVYCDGTGTLTQEQKAQLDYEDNAWCDCGNPSGKVNYWENGEGELCEKHHYTCDDCDKIVQIG